MKAILTFTRINQGTHLYHTEDGKDELRATLCLSVTIDGTTYDNLEVDIAQPKGDDFDALPVTVKALSIPGYSGPWNHIAYADAAEHYYRKLAAKAFSIASAARNLQMQENVIMSAATYEIEFEAESAPGW